MLVLLLLLLLLLLLPFCPCVAANPSLAWTARGVWVDFPALNLALPFYPWSFDFSDAVVIRRMHFEPFLAFLFWF